LPATIGLEGAGIVIKAGPGLLAKLYLKYKDVINLI